MYSFNNIESSEIMKKLIYNDSDPSKKLKMHLSNLSEISEMVK